MCFRTVNVLSMYAAIAGVVIAYLIEIRNWRTELMMSIIIGSCIIWGSSLVAMAILAKKDN